MSSAALPSAPLPYELPGAPATWQAPLRLVHDATPAPIAPPVSPARASHRLLACDDDALLRLAVGGRAEPFAVAYERHRGPLFRYCLAMTSHRDDAADAAQDAWLRAFAALRRVPFEPRPFRPWIYAIARNACIDRLRGRGRMSMHELDEADLAPAPSPEQERAAREEVRNVLADLARLPLLERSEILMRDLAGLSHEEIARELHISVRRSRALAGEARSFLHDRRAGRAMPCGDVRTQLERPRQGRNRRLRAHLDDCELCAALERRGRARKLSSLAVAPLALLRALNDRAATWLASPAEGLTAAAAGRGGAALAVAAVAVGGGATVAPSTSAPEARPGPVASVPDRAARAAAGAPARRTATAQPRTRRSLARSHRAAVRAGADTSPTAARAGTSPAAHTSQPAGADTPSAVPGRTAGPLPAVSAPDPVPAVREPVAAVREAVDSAPAVVDETVADVRRAVPGAGA